MEKLNRVSSFFFNTLEAQSNFALSYESKLDTERIDVYSFGSGMVSFKVNHIFEITSEPDLDLYQKQSEKGEVIANDLYNRFIESNAYKRNKELFESPYSIADKDRVLKFENLNLELKRWMIENIESFDFIK
ncbi:hypothetical protein PQ478_08800 [Alkalihalophilus pseudofirmus]|uniref:hypothetical protein n=1 Tax=Alkalihalophilus pseudofirmus TaxID=79885 RepID=UPI00259AF7F1|nr:hypothetical protein [Alkalihalophilus pseudofirmus]WEG18568.1 hypothetical protein PQ478_08800 [Alkalihalophilus pseudofirmus]